MEKTHDDLFLSASAMDRLNLFKTIQHQRRAQATVSEQLTAQQNKTSLVTDVNLRQVATLAGRNYGSIYNIYNDLLVVLEALSGDSKTDLADLFAVSVPQLRFHMIQQTTTYRFLQALLAPEVGDFDDFTAGLDISKMTATRHMRAFRALAKRFGVTIRREKMVLSGSEQRIRLFLMTAFWNATQGVAWPFTHISHDSAAALVDTLYQTLDCQPANANNRELSMYYLAVAYWRVQNGHVLSYERNQTVLDYPLPNLDLALGSGRFADFRLPPLTRNQMMGETAFGFFLMHYAPVYLVADDPSMVPVIDRYRRYAPAVYALVSGFVKTFPDWAPDLTEATRQLLIANLLAVANSVLTLGEDFNLLVAYTFNHELNDQASAPHFERLVRQTVTQVVLAQHLEDYIDKIDDLAAGFYDNLRQMRAVFRPQGSLKVALVLEQSTMTYIDLIAMLRQQSFVTILPSTADIAGADLVIQTGALPLKLPASTAVFEWQPNASAERYGELFALLVSLWQNKHTGVADLQQRA